MNADPAPDVALLADFVDALERGLVPTQAALEEAQLLVESFPAARRELRRRAVVRQLERVRAESPGLKSIEVARRVAARTRVPLGTVRWFAWASGTSTGNACAPGEMEPPRLDANRPILLRSRDEEDSAPQGESEPT